MHPGDQRRVFLSYARKDGELFASALRRRLAAHEPEVAVWQDRSALEGGVGWWNQIEAALDHAKFMVAIMTPAAVASEVTRREWRYARRRGVIVYPVKGVPVGRLEYDALPGWMRKAHFFDIGRFEDGEWHDAKEWDTFVNYLKSDRQSVRAPFMAPDFPDGFVAREKEYRQILDLILDGPRQNPIAITTALQGAGGYGKTTLAIALCHDPRVIEAFDDGILWVSLGQTPNLLSELVELYDALTGERHGFVDVAQASSQLRDKLAHRNCLVVIDDVWDGAHAKPFLHGGPGCARVVTTRLSDLLSHAVRVRVDEMSAGQSRQVIATGFGAALPGERELDALARRLGEWPLLLRLAAGMVRRRLDVGDSTDGALTYVHRALDKRGVTAFDRADRAQRDAAVAKTLAASLDQLATPDRRRLIELAIFPEETAVPLTTIARLWDLDDLDTEDCVQRLHDASLLSLDLHHGVITLHDVMRAYLLTELDDAAPTHAKLILNYGDWRRLPDRYAWHWLSYHLVAAGDHERLRGLLVDVEWLTAKLATTSAEALLADFDRLPDEADATIVRGAILLSGHILRRHPDQLASQLLGRIRARVSEGLDRVRADAIRCEPGPCLRLHWPSLAAPASTLLQTLAGHDRTVGGVLALPDDRLLSWGWDDETLRLWNVATGEGRVLGRSVWISGVLLIAGNKSVTWGEPFLQVWDLATGHTRVVACQSPDGTLWTYDEGGNATTATTGRLRGIHGGTMLPNGALLCWGPDWLGQWNLATGECRLLDADWTGDPPIVTDDSVLFSTDRGHLVRRGTDLLTGTGRLVTSRFAIAVPIEDGRVLLWADDGGLQVWDRDDLTRVQATVAWPGPIREVRSLGHGQVLAFLGDRFGYDTSMFVFNLATGDGRGLSGHTGDVAGALALADNQLLSWSADHTIRRWDLTTGESRVLAESTRLTDAILLESGDVVSWGSDLRVWNIRTGDWFALTEQTTAVSGAIALKRDQLLTWGDDGPLRLWRVATPGGDESTTHAGPVAGLALLDTGDAVSWAHRDLTLWLRGRNDSTAHPLEGHTGAILGARQLSGGSVVSWSADGSMRQWNTTSREGRVLHRHGLRVRGALELGDGRLISWSEDNTLIVNDLAGGVRVLTGHWRGIDGALEMSDGSVLSWSDDYTIRWWNLRTGDSREFARTYAEVRGALQVGAAQVVIWDASGELRFWDLESGRSQTWAQRDDGHFGRGPWRGALLLDEAHVISWSDAIWIWDLASGEGRVLAEQRPTVDAVILADGTLVSCGLDSAIRVQGAHTGEHRRLMGQEADVSGVVSMGRGRIASWAADHSVMVWETGTGRLVGKFYFDARLTVVRASTGNELVVGDDAGRVHFLEGVGFER